jgi:hypothetical protein
VVATPLRDELPTGVGGTEIGPLIAAGEDALWVGSQESTYPYRTLAIRVDARTNEVARERPSVDHFWPFAAVADGVWFLGRDRHGTVSRLDPRTLEVNESVDLGIDPIDAAFDSAGGSVWVASQVNRARERAAIVRVDMR